MQDKRDQQRPQTKQVYEIDGASFGLGNGLAEAIKSSISRRLASNTLEIPRLPQVAGRILQLAHHPETDVDDVVRAIATDPFLASRILSVANSAAYGGGDAVNGLHPAVMRLGMKFVQDLVFAESVRLKVFSGRAYRLTLEQSWRQSLGTAIGCDALSRITGLEPTGGFMLGLLHDIGVPVLVSAVSEYERQNKGRALGDDVVEILMSQLHEEVGAYVLKNWAMPDSFVSAARAHHLYKGGAKATSAQKLVYAGNLICQHLGLADDRREVNFLFQEVFVDLHLADMDKVAPILEFVNSQFNGMVAGMHEEAA